MAFVAFVAVTAAFAFGTSPSVDSLIDGPPMPFARNCVPLSERDLILPGVIVPFLMLLPLIVAAAYPTPPSVKNSARQATTIAGDGRLRDASPHRAFNLRVWVSQRRRVADDLRDRKRWEIPPAR